MSTITKRLHATAVRLAYAFCFFSIFTSSANAIFVDTVGDSFEMDFAGYVNGNDQPGLTAYALFYLDSIVDNGSGGQDWTFNVSLANTSSDPITASRISIMGFNLSPKVDTTDVSVSGAFDTVASGNMPMAGKTDLCFKVGGSSNNCAGGGGAGIEIGETEAFSFTISFDDILTELNLRDFVVRYQSISGSEFGDSGIGISTGATPTAVPVPAAAWLMGSALAGLGLVARRRNQ